MISQLVGLGHNVGNHSQNHLVIVGLTPLEIWYEFLSPQVFLLDEHQRSFHPFRTPGLWWNDYAYDVMAAHPYLNKLSGPIHADAGGQGFLELPGKDKVWLGGDWDCFRQGYSASVCGEMYYNYLRDLPHGAILLMHVRTEYMSGKEDTGDFPLRLAQYIVERLGAQYRYVALESLFGASSAELPPRGRERQWEVP
jgi:peptidoglycan/xylan/chitin deacetylase (PgdA/CDA1 family)